MKTALKINKQIGKSKTNLKAPNKKQANKKQKHQPQKNNNNNNNKQTKQTNKQTPLLHTSELTSWGSII